MPIEAFASQNCSVAQPLAFLGERWSILVLRLIFVGFRRFDEIQGELGIATNVLSQRLATLVDEGIIERRPYSEHPERFEYRLTEKGLELWPVLVGLLRFGDRHYPAPGGPPRVLEHRGCGGEVTDHLQCARCGAELGPRDVRALPGPGLEAA